MPHSKGFIPIKDNPKFNSVKSHYKDYRDEYAQLDLIEELNKDVEDKDYELRTEVDKRLNEIFKIHEKYNEFVFELTQEEVEYILSNKPYIYEVPD
jgi:hypothetical protein